MTFRPRAAAIALAVFTAAAPARAQPAAGVGSAAAVAVPAPPTDPFPIRRILLSPDRIDSVLGPAGVLRRMPRDEFEAKVRAATAAQTASANPPRLIEARYRATLTDGSLSGTAEWAVAHPGGPGAVPLDPLRVAVADPQWAAGRTAVLLPGPPRLLADRPSDTALSFRWSARAADEPGAERFDLGLPPIPIAVLDLDLPVGRVPAADPPAARVSGPFPGAAPDRRRWSVAFGGVENVSLTVRRPAGAGEPPPLVRAAQAIRYVLTPGEVTAAFEFDWEAVRGAVDELAFAAAPGLRVKGVDTGRPATWRDEPGIFRVPLRGPTASGKVTITAVAITPSSATDGWSLPEVRLVGGLPGPEAVELRTDPDVRFLGLDPGGYRVTDAGATDDRGGYRVALTGTLTGEADRRPSVVRFGPAGPSFAVTEDVTWRPGPGRATLSGRFRLRVDRGPVAEIPLEATPGFVLRSVTLTPDDPGVGWTAGGRPGTWTIEPSRPVSAGQTVEVRVELAGNPAFPPPDPATAVIPRRLPFPRLTVPGGGERDGTFTVLVPAALHGVTAPLPPEPTGPGQTGGPAAFAYPYRGRGPDGVLVVGPRPPRVVATADTTVSLDPAGLEAASRIRLRCETGEAGGVTLFLPDPPGGPAAWDVKPKAGDTSGPAVRSELLLGLGVADGWGAVGRIGVAAASPGWVHPVRFARPLRGDAEITTTARWPVGDGPAVVPVPTIGGADAGVITVALAPSAAARFDPPNGPTGGFPAVAPLPLRGASPAGAESRTWRFADVIFTTTVEADGRMRCDLTGRVTEAGGPTLPVELPAGVTVLDVRAGGRVADPMTVGGDGGTHLDVPLPVVGPNGLPFDIRYRLPAASPGPVARFHSPLPGLPAATDTRRRWAINPEFRPAPSLLPHPGPADDARETVVAVRAGWLSATGFAAASVVGGLGLTVAARRRRVGLIVVAVVCGGLSAGAWLLPAGWHAVLVPPLLAGLLAVAGFRRADPPPRMPTGFSTRSHRAAVWPSSSPAAVAGVPLALAGLVVFTPAAAQVPELVTVYLTPAAGGRLDALVPSAVLDRLDALARPLVAGPVITTAKYDGTSTDTTATFDATFAVWCPPGGTDLLALPLAGGRLLSLTVDGADGYPVPAGPDRYAVTIPGPGPHTVRARFEVPIAATGSDPEARFTVPDVPDTSVGFAAPAGAGRPEVVTRRGGQLRNGERVEADHGGGAAVAVRWRAGGPIPSSAARVEVRSACVWDVREGEASAAAGFLVRADGGAASRLRFDIPDGLEPGQVTGQPGGVRDWTLSPGPAGWRVLDVGLQTPLTGKAVVGFRLYPTRPAGGNPVLRFPRPHGADESDAVYAVRLAGVTTDAIDRAGLIDVPPDVLAREFAGVPDLGADRGPVRAFRRSGAGTPELRLSLRPTAVAATGAAETTWAVGPRAEAEGVVRAVGADGPMAAVEFELPATVEVQGVYGPDVATWGRVGDRVQAWLKRPAREAVVRWSGGLPGYRPPAAGETPTAVELPAARGPGGGAAVRVRPAAGWGLVPQPVRGLRLAPDTADPGGERFTADPAVAPTPAARVLLFPPTAGKVQALESIEPTGPGSVYRADLLIGVRPGRPASFTLLLTGGGRGGKIDLPSPGLTATGPTPTPDGPAWVVTAPPAAAGSVRLTVAVPLPAGKDARLPEPVVWFGTTRVVADRRALAVTDSRVSPAGPRAGWEPATAADRDALTAHWPAEAGRVAAGRAWVGGRGPGADRLAVFRNAEFGMRNESPPAAPGIAAVQSPTGVDSTFRNPNSAFAFAGWLAVFVAVVAVAGWGRPGRWGPERLVGCGLLGVTVPGVGAAAAVGCGLVAAAGAGLRIGRAVFR